MDCRVDVFQIEREDKRNHTGAISQSKVDVYDIRVNSWETHKTDYERRYMERKTAIQNNRRFNSSALIHPQHRDLQEEPCKP